MADLENLLKSITLRYRIALLKKALLLFILLLCLILALAWRLHVSNLKQSLAIFIPAVFAAAGSLGYWARRKWISEKDLSNRLDKELNLQQRLITAVEFSVAKEPPALYPLLLEDALKRCRGSSSRLPRVFDRGALVLALLVLLLLLFPLRSRNLAQIAMLKTKEPSSITRIQQQPPDAKLEDSADRNRQSPQKSSSGSGENQPSPSGGNQSSQSQGASNMPQDGGDSSKDKSSKDGQAKESSGASSDDMRRQNSLAQQTEQSAQRQHDNSQEEGKGADIKLSQNSKQGKQQSGARESSSATDNGADRAGAQRSDSEAQNSAKGEIAKRDRNGSEKSASDSVSMRRESGNGKGNAIGNQEATKAQIQELLKEVSEELKQLQTQLASAKDQAHPEPGTSTDPNLYGSSAIDHAAGAALPIQLPTDAAQIKSQRPGGGTGKPSDEVSKDSPKLQPEDAKLSDEPTEESSSDRQIIPPEYKDIFERLHKRSEIGSQSSEQPK